jgi:hypothetical protein
MSEAQRREFHEAMLDAGVFEDLPGKWQVAILTAEQNRPKLRLVSRDYRARYPCQTNRRRSAAASSGSLGSRSKAASAKFSSVRVVSGRSRQSRPSLD